jgi:group I intron endonuclease
MKKSEERVGCVYLLRCLVNGKGYVGQHSKPQATVRWNAHILMSNQGDMRPLYRAIRKYGVELFSAEVLWCGPVSRLNKKEVYYIKDLNTFIDDGHGYNLTRGGDQPLWSKVGRKHISDGLHRYHQENPDAILLMSERSTKSLSNPEVRSRMSESGKRLWAEGSSYRKKTVKSFQKRWKDPVKKAAAVAAMQTPEARIIVNDALRKYWAKPEPRKKMSDIAKIWWKDPAYRYRQEHPTKEISAKLSAAARRRWDKVKERKAALNVR